jgi:hypothetical protein
MENTESTYRGLTLGCIHECRADRCRENHISEALLLENSRSGLCGIKCSIDIDVHDFLEFLGCIVFGRMLGANSSVGKNNIQPSKVLHDLIYRRRYFLGGSDIGFVSAGFSLIIRRKFFCSFWCGCSRAIKKSNLENGSVL